MPRLDMCFRLGGETNANKMLLLLKLIESVHLDEFPITNSHRKQKHIRSGPGLGRNTTLAGDYIISGPWEYRNLTRGEAEEYRAAPQQTL